MVALVCACILFAAPAHAQVAIDVSWGRHERVFNERNIAPGTQVRHTITVTNAGDVQDVYLTLRHVRGRALARHLRVALIEKKTGAYLIGGPGERMTVRQLAAAKRVFVQRLGAGERRRYTLLVTFDKDAGNTLQGASTRFDLTFGVTGEPVSPSAPLPRRHTPGAAAHRGDVLGAETVVDDDVQDAVVLGADGVARRADAVVCAGWERLAWLTGLLVFSGLVALTVRRTRAARRADGTVLRAPVVVLLLFSMLLFVAWFVIAQCPTTWWFPLGVLAGSLVAITVQRRP